MLYAKILRARVRYILSDLFQLKKWVGCKHFKSYIFEVFADKHGQVAGDSMTRSRWSSGGSRLLMKALYSSPPTPR